MTGKTWTPDAEWTRKYLRIVEANPSVSPYRRDTAPKVTLPVSGTRPDAVTSAAPKVTLPVRSTPPDAVTSAAPKVSLPANQAERNSFAAKTGRVAGNYLGKMVSGVGAAFANTASMIPGAFSNVVSLEAEQRQLARDRENLKRLKQTAWDTTEEEQRIRDTQTRIGRLKAGQEPPDTAYQAQKKLEGLSDRLAGSAEKFRKAAEADTAPVLRPILNTATNLVPFLALNAVPGGQAAAGAYLVGESTGDARRAGLSESSQAALGLAAVLSMGAAGQVGKALGGEKVVGWFLKHGKGPEFARVLEQAAASGFATGVTRQATTAATKAALGVYGEQVEAARKNLDTLSKADTASLTPEERAAYDSAVAANQAVVDSHGMDFTAALAGIGVEILFSLAGAAVSYGRYYAKRGPNFTTSGEKPLTPETSEYFKGVRTPEEAHRRLKELARKYHPDISAEANATEIMQRINSEYERLGPWMKARQGVRAKNVTDTWAKAKSGRGVTKEEAAAVNGEIAGLLESVREAGDAETVAALEQILAPMAAEINSAPAPVMPETLPVTPEAAAPNTQPVPAAPMTPAPRYAPETLQAMQSLSATLPPTSPQAPTPFVTFDEWRKRHPEVVASTDAAAREEVAALLGDAHPGATPEPTPTAPVVATPTTTPIAPEAQSVRPVAPLPETVPEPEPAPKAVDKNPLSNEEKPVETPQAPNAKLRELSERLNQSTRVYMDGLKFEYGWMGPSSAYASIRRVDPEEENLLYPIQNAANDLYREYYPSDYEARNALIQIAATLPGFRATPEPAPAAPFDKKTVFPQNTPAAPGGYPVQQTDGQTVPANPEEVANHERRGENASGGHEARPETRDGGGILEPSGVGEMVSELGGALDAEDVRTPEEAGKARGEVLPVGRRDNGHPVGELQHAGNVGRTGTRPGAVHEQPGGVAERPDETPATGAPAPSPKAKSRKAAKPKAEAVAAEPVTPKEQTAAEVQRKTEQSAAPRGTDFAFPEGGLQLPNGEKSRAKANLSAIELLRRLETEQRPATPEEQSTLARFVGWGGLSGIFDENKADWAALRGQLKNALSEEEYAAAARSTLNAHYTSQEVISAVYDALEHIGFRGGRVLEPAAGVGHFAGGMPANLRAKSRWTMVELDPVTGGIAKALYPNADVRVQGFENALLPDNYYDAAISNVPFGDIQIHDPAYKPYLTRSIHNYFFAKAFDKVRPGGVVAFVTSRYTMDSAQEAVRQYLGTQADLLGAVRLPDTAFKSNAGTDVVTDILFFKKREPNTPYAGEKFLEASRQTYMGPKGYAGGYVNEYFLKHPEMVLGTPDRGTMYNRNDGLTWRPKDTNKPLREQIREAVSAITGTMEYPSSRTQADIKAEIRRDAAKGKVGGLVKKDGKIYRNTGETLVEASDIPKKSLQTVGQILSIRDAARALLSFQQDGAPDKQIQNSRKGLNALYDDFVKKNGPLHLPKNQRLVKLDTEAPFIFSLEKYDKDTRTATKSDLFTKNTVAPNVAVTRADSIEDALAVSLNETGRVDAERIAALTAETPEAVAKSLLERGLAFLNRDGALETAEQYLSGNVRAKLKDAKALAAGNPDYNRNVEALEKIIPADIEPENIKVQIGATWVPTTAYGEFAAEMAFGKDVWPKSIQVTYQPALGEYRVTMPDNYVRQRLKTSVGNTTKWGTKDRTFLEILSATLNNKDLNVWRKRSDGSRILDTDATEAVKQKARDIQNEFQDWLFRDPERRDTLARLYNDVFNNSVTPRYDGSKLTIKGMNTGITLNPHQKNAVHRIVNSGGNTLLAHRVGAGKTYEMAAAAMKLRELGVCRKPVFVVPKSLTGQWGREFLDLFPAAKILVPGDDFSAASRKEYVNRIATGDYDAVILSYEQFKAIPMSDAYRAEFIKGQIAELSAALEAEKADKSNRRSPSVKQMEKKKANLEAELKKLMDKKEDTDNINFEALGVDSLFVDEAHNMKNLFYTTHMNNVTGLGNKEGSQQALDLFMKTRYLQKLNGGRGIVFATATPVMNSIVELYTMQNYLQPDELAARGIYNFDAWANQFAEVRTELQISPSGQGGRLKETLSRYNNLNALQQMFTQFMDVVTDIPGLKIPKMKGGKRIVVECEPGEYQLSYMKELAKRAEKLKSSHVDPKVDNILKIGNDGRKISYSQRVMEHSLPYEPEGKIMKCAGNVAEIWKETADRKGTQIVFCDYSTPKASTATGAKGAEAELSQAEAALDAQEEAEAVTIYQDMKNILVGMGVPANEIAFIHDAKNVEQRNQLFDDMNAGKVRILIGSTGKMGVGMNAQKRVTALHHLDAPQRPGDVEQREGRALRQGNMNDEVGIYVYVTNNTFDARSWDILQRKWTFNAQLQSGDFTGNSFEGDADVLSAAEIKAIASGNPLIQEQNELSMEIRRLEGLERAHRREVFAAQDRLRVARASIAADTETAAKLRADIAARVDTSGKNFSLTLNGKTVTERKAAGEALIRAAKQFLKPGQSPEATKKIGTFAGFDLLATSGGELVLRGQGRYRSAVNFESAVGTVQSLEAAARKLDSTLSDTESRLAMNRDALPELEKASEAVFPRAAELEQKRRRAGEILVELSDGRGPSGENGDDDGTDAFREAWEVVDDDSGVLKFREASAAKLGSHPDRWTAERVGDDTVKPLTGSEVIAKWRKILFRNVTIGHIRGARGQYQRQKTGIGSGGIRLKVAGDVPVFTHELGHAYDEQYHFSEILRNPGKDMDDKVRLSKDGQNVIRVRVQAAQELKNNLDPQFAAQYKDEQLLGEGVAEFFRRFCQNRVRASVDYPMTYRFVMTTLSGKDQAQLLAMADDVNALYSLDTDTAQSSIRHMGAKAPDYRTGRERFDTLKDRFLQATVDSLHSVRKLSQMMDSDVYRKFYNAAYADSRAYFNLTEHLCDLNGQFIGPSLRTVLHGVNVNDPREFNAFGEYLIVCNAPSWLVDDKRVLANDRKNNLLYCELRKKELEQQYPMFKATSEALYDYWDKFMRTYVVGTGIISREQYEAMRAKHPYYVPFRRVMDDVKGFGTHRTFANQPNPIQRAKGSGRDIIHPVESIINTVAKLTYQGIHQQTMLDFIDVADAYGLDAAFMERVPAPLVKQTADISGVKAGIAERVANSDLPETDVELLLKILDEQGDVMSWYSQSAYLPKDCIAVRRNGEREVYKINDPLLFDALANMGRPQLHEYLKPINDITRAVSSLITGYNLPWNIFSNAPRDIQTALISSKGGHRAKLLLKTVDSYLSAVAKARNAPNVNPYYMEYLAMGGGDSSAWGMDTKLPKKILSETQGSTWKQRVRHPLNTLKDSICFLSGTIEAGPRFATYEMFREDGADPQTAFRAAMEVTVDFRKGGRISRAINAFMPFFNAGVQGMVKDMDMLTHAGKAGLITFFVASLIGAAMEYALNGMTEERRNDYNRLSTYTKNSYYCIPIGDRKFFGIPKARGMLIPENFFRALMERTIGGNRHAYDGFWGYAATAELPNGLSDVITLNPSSLFGTVTIIGPMAQIWANADFRGMPIESARDRKLSPRQRYTGSTSQLAKSVGDALNLSPKQIDFFGNNTLGAAWQYQKALFPVDPSKRDWTLGVKSKYVKDSLYSQDSVNRLYDLAEKSSRASMDDLTDTDSKVTAYFDGAMTDFYSRYNSVARSEDDAGKSDREARELVLTEIEEYLSAREEGFRTAEQEAVYNVCRAAGDTSGMLPSARQTSVKDGAGTVHNLSAARYYDYQGNFNSLYWNLVKEALPGVGTDAERESVLKYAVDAAGEMAKNNALMKLGAPTTKEYGKFEELQLYSVPVSAYLVAKAKTKDIESLKHKRTGKEIPDSKSALVAEAVLEMNLGLPDTNVRKLMETVGVGKTVREWKRSKLERELKQFRKDAGTG